MGSNHLAIAARGLTKEFGEFPAVTAIDLNVRHGEIFGLLGPNGSGKTTTIRMMLGLLEPTAGTVQVLGVSVDRHAERIRPRIGYMSQRFSLYNDLTVLQNLRFYGRAYGLSNSLLRERIQDALKMAGLEGRERVHTKDLSGGWRQRLALSAAILHRPVETIRHLRSPGIHLIRSVHRDCGNTIFLGIDNIRVTLLLTLFLCHPSPSPLQSRRFLLTANLFWKTNRRVVISNGLPQGIETD